MDTASIPFARKATVLKHSDSGLYAVEKAAGLKSHPNRDGEPAVVMAPYDKKEEAYRLPDGSRLYLCNRLDTPTAGILLLADNRDCAQWVKRAFRERRVRKTYLAGVRGRPEAPSGRWSDALHIRKGGGKLRVRVGRGESDDAVTRSAVTDYRVLQTHRKLGFEASLLELHPETGRTHQLRVQAGQRGIPVLGDKTYGDFQLNKTVRKMTGTRHLLLHAQRIEIEPEDGAPEHAFTAASPLPDWINKWFAMS